MDDLLAGRKHLDEGVGILKEAESLAAAVCFLGRYNDTTKDGALAANDHHTAYELLLSVKEDEPDVNERIALVEYVSELLRSSEHWRPNIALSWRRLLFILDAFIKGENPPFRCSGLSPFYANVQCMECISDGLIYCRRYHACRSRSCLKAKLSMEVDYCEDHRCMAVSEAMCGLHRFSGSSFCVDHSCPGCASLNQAPILQKDGPSACRLHECQAQLCSTLQLIPYKFCQDHCCRICLKFSADEMAPQLNGFTLCVKHKCGFEGCARGFDAPSRFCYQHTCRACVDVTSLQPIDKQCMSSNFCAAHRFVDKLSPAMIQKSLC